MKRTAGLTGMLLIVAAMMATGAAADVGDSVTAYGTVAYEYDPWCMTSIYFLDDCNCDECTEGCSFLVEDISDLTYLTNYLGQCVRVEGVVADGGFCSGGIAEWTLTPSDYCADDDGDGVPNGEDNCPQAYNPGQEDVNQNGVGDACDMDCCINRGDVDHDADPTTGPDIEDLVYMIQWMFESGPPPPCLGEADVNVDGGVDIADLLFIVNYMFLGDFPPPPCP